MHIVISRAWRASEIAQFVRTAATRASRACAGGAEADVHRLVAGEIARRETLAELPWPSIVASVAGWQGRRARRAKDES